VLPGCVGVFGSQSKSYSIGSHSNGVLLHGVAMPFEGTGYYVHPDWRARSREYTTEEIAKWLTEIFVNFAEKYPGSKAYLGDFSARGGGGASMHRSHMSGRDFDIFYFACDADGQEVKDLPAMLRFNGDGSIASWSTGRKRSLNQHLPEAGFDVRRNWAVVREMLSNPTVEVQWIFIHHELANLIIAEAEQDGTPPSLLARVRAVLHQPTDSQPHDDHMHVRVFCDPADRSVGCTDKGPRRWLKKYWKYMARQMLASSHN
jgi:penicillin-insensitive murein DD-endopeptidase